MKDYESIIFGNLGQCGLFQICIFIACNLADAPASWAMTLMSFAGASPDWWSVSRDFNQTANFTSNDTKLLRRYKTCPSTPDEYIEFSKDISTIVSEWELVCDRDWIPTTITTIQMAGVLIGAFVMGQLGDVIGRKKSFYSEYFFMMLFTFISAFSNSWQMFAAFRFLIGLTLGGHLVVSFSLLIEYIGTKWRTIGGSFPTWALGIALLGLVSWILEDWRKLSIVASAMGAPLLLTWWFVPESCRWLLSQGRLVEAETVLKRMSKLNRRPAPDLTNLKSVMSHEVEQAAKKHTYSLADLFKHREMFKKLLIFSFMFFSVVLGYYGFTLGVTELSGNRHLNLFLNGFVEACSSIALILLGLKFKRRNSTMLLFMLGGAFSLAITITYFSAPTALFQKLQNIFAMSAKFFLSAAFSSVYLTMAEVFPTVIRNLGIGAVSTAGRLGGLMAPQVVYLHKVNVAIPYVICGSVLTLSGMLCFLLKDTYQSPLPDEFEPDGADRANNILGMTNNIGPNEI